ncbi:hypothetical protein Tco_1562650 [Tanacetum coccineum]
MYLSKGIAREVQSALYSTQLEFRGDLEDENELDILVEEQFVALQKALKISNKANEARVMVAMKFLTLFRAENASLPNASSTPIEVVESFSTVQAYGGSEFVTDDMEHDQTFDGGYAPLIRFEIQPDICESLYEDEEDMSGDERDEIDEDEDGDDEGRNDLEEDEEHHLPHPDTHQDDHEIEDEFNEDMIEEEDEDEEDDDDGVILRLEMNGINVLDHIEVFGRDHSFPNDTLHVMHVEVFGSLRQGPTTSIYNLLCRSGDSSVPFQHPLLMEPYSKGTAAGDLLAQNAEIEGHIDGRIGVGKKRFGLIVVEKFGCFGIVVEVEIVEKQLEHQD